MVVNSKHLYAMHPLDEMYKDKQKDGLVSHGMSEAGYDIRTKQRLVLSPFRRFVLASSIEKFQMPPYLMAIVHDKSSWARRGVSVFNTVVEPGWSGWLTLEIVYHGMGRVVIPAGSGIAQVIFHEVSSPVSYDGRYQNQPDAPVKARKSNE